MRSHPAAPVLLALALLVGTAGCRDDSADRTAVATAAATATATARATVEPSVLPFPTSARPVDGGHGSGNGLGVTGVRTSHRPGYDRVVFDLDGTGSPGWYVSYTANPVAEGSGDRVVLEGTTYLSVVLRGVGLPFDTGVPAYGDDTTRIAGTGTKGVAEIAPGGVFEGDQLAYIGLTGAQRPFRVFALTDPARVVVDVRSPPGGS